MFGADIDASAALDIIVCISVGASFLPRDDTAHPVRAAAAPVAEFTRPAWVYAPGSLAFKSSPSSVDAVSGIVEA
jgi:hypothetical protein